MAQVPTWAAQVVLLMECSQAVPDLRVLHQVECRHLTECPQVVSDPMVLPVACLQAVCLPAAVLQVQTLPPAATRAICSAILSSLRPISEQNEADQLHILLSAKYNATTAIYSC